MIIPHWYFLDYLTQYEGDRSQQSWDSNKMVQAVKGRPVNGFIRIKVGGTVRRYEQDNIGSLTASLLGTVGSHMGNGLITQEATIIPIPNSDMTSNSGEDHPIIHSASAVLNGYNHSRKSAIDVDLSTSLRWTEPHKPSNRQSGFRSPNDYTDKLVLTSEIARPVIVFDDVYTSGSQAKAACDFLNKNDVDIIAIVTVAKTVHEPSESPISWRESSCNIQEGLFGGLV